MQQLFFYVKIYNMKTMRIAICDDEAHIRESVGTLVRNNLQDCLIDMFCAGEELLSAPEVYDIYFLDIQMPGLDGMETAELLRDGKAEESVIIFITAFTEFMANAFDVNAFHYLVKPVDEEKFESVFLKALAALHKLQKDADRFIIVKSEDTRVKILTKDIFYVESRGKKIVIHSRGGIVETYGKIGAMEESLGDMFYRCHRCYMVNMGHIKRYNAATIRLVNGDDIILAQKKYPDFVKTFMRFVGD